MSLLERRGSLFAHHPDHPGHQHAERAEHENADQDGEETVHTKSIGARRRLWRAGPRLPYVRPDLR